MKMTIEFSGRFADVKEYRYGGRNLHAGDEFECEDKDVDLLTALGIAVQPRSGVSRPPKPGSKPETKEEVAEDEDDAAEMAKKIAPKTPPAPKRYRRRDMRAE